MSLCVYANRISNWHVRFLCRPKARPFEERRWKGCRAVYVPRISLQALKRWELRGNHSQINGHWWLIMVYDGS